jgi:hypothetical protein
LQQFICWVNFIFRHIQIPSYWWNIPLNHIKSHKHILSESHSQPVLGAIQFPFSLRRPWARWCPGAPWVISESGHWVGYGGPEVDIDQKQDDFWNQPKLCMCSF